MIPTIRNAAVVEPNMTKEEVSMRRLLLSRLPMFFSLFLLLCFAATLKAQDQANEIVCSSTTACTSGFIPIFSSSGGSAKVSKSLLSQSGSTVSLNGNEAVTGNLSMANSGSAAGNILKGGSLFLHNFGFNNTFLGQNAGNLTMTSTGNNNVGVGTNALHSATTGCCNTASGNNALWQNTTGGGNTASGDGALYSNTTGSGNTATGRWALISNSTGSNNTATGTTALQNNCLSSSCLVSPAFPMGSSNTATGVGALYSNIDGIGNTATGVNALHNNCVSPCFALESVAGSNNTGTGVNALYNNAGGESNSASGGGALFKNTTGSDNAAEGVNALYSNTTGNFNTAIGYNADVSQGDLFNATAIGYEAVVNASNKIRLGNSSVTVVEGPPYSVVSDKTKKENFKAIDAEEVLRKVRDLSVTSWNYIGHDPSFRHYGPVAQDFFAAFGNDGLGTIGSSTTITSTDLDGVLLLAVQALEKRMAELTTVKAENADLKARLEKLEAIGLR